jgi:ABC transporter fused permease/ATP-binding protein
MSSPPEKLPPHVPRPPLRLILRHMRELVYPEAPRLAVGTFFLFIASATSLLYPQVVRLVVDEALSAGDRELIQRASLGMMALFTVQAVAVALRYYLFATASERVVMRLREQLFSSLLAQEVAFFDERKTGELTSRLASDTTVLQLTVSANLSMSLHSVAQVVGGLALLLYTSPALTAMMLAVVPAVSVGGVLYGRRVRQTSKEVQDALAVANEVAEESLSGIRTVRSFAAERHELGRYRSSLEHAFQLARWRARHFSTFNGVSSLSTSIAATVVVWYGGLQVVAGELSVGNLTSFLVYALVVALALSGLTSLWAELMRASGAAERVFELIERRPAIPSSGGLQPATLQGRVELQGVHFSYPARPDAPALRGIDLTLAPGEVLALVGPSGAGKSTIAALLARLYDPQSGCLRVDGHDVRTLDPEWLRRQLGVVAQEPLLFSCSIGENIRYGRGDATDEEVEAAARAANAHEFISQLSEGYDTLVGERGVRISGGQKQRVAIARALLKDPRLLILDEATSALDAESEHLVQEALERLLKGRTTLIIAHRLSTVMGADRVVVLERGRVVQSGSHAALMGQEGLYRRLVERQFVAA